MSNGIGRALKPQRCMVCFGCGYVVCDACKARGKTGGLGLAGDERGRECAACSGDGIVKCEACNATGIKNNWLSQPASAPGWGPRGEP